VQLSCVVGQVPDGMHFGVAVRQQISPSPHSPEPHKRPLGGSPGTQADASLRASAPPCASVPASSLLGSLVLASSFAPPSLGGGDAASNALHPKSTSATVLPAWRSLILPGYETDAVDGAREREKYFAR